MRVRTEFVVAKFLRKFGKHSFILSLNTDVKILDVGCGNNSSFKVKGILKNCHYTGIDIGDYNQTKPNLADQYILTSPESFALEIEKFNNHFDAIICSHNIEHCNDRYAVISAIMKALKRGGRLYLSFPCEESIGFPSRVGTLNYLDDNTHVPPPPNLEDIVRRLNEKNIELEILIKRHRPFILRYLGFLLEPLSALRKKVLRGTWEYYGFETIIWAVKK